MHPTYQKKQASIDSPSRRDFVKMAGMISAAFMLPGATQPLWARSAPSKAGGLHGLSPFFLMERSALLAQGDSRMSGLMRYALDNDIAQMKPGNSFFMGIALPFETSEVVEALGKLKEGAADGQLDYKQTERFSVLSGALTARAIAQNLAEADAHTALQGIDGEVIRNYRDAAILRHYFTKAHPEGTGDQLSSLLKQMVPRTFTRFHTIIPDTAAGMEWVTAMQDWRKETHDYYGSLGVATVNPDKKTYELVVEKANFLQTADPLLVKISSFNRISGRYGDEGIALANAQGVTDADKVKAQHQKATCFASKALVDGCANLLFLDDFWQGKISQKELLQRIKA